MQLTGHANNLDLVSETRDLCDADSTSYALAKIVRRINAGLELLIGKIISADGRWQWDDTNFSTLPRGTGTLVEGQSTYSFAAEYLDIQMIEVLRDSSPDVWVKLKPIDSLELGGLSPSEYFGLESNGDQKKGMPEYYDKWGDTIILYPAPAAANVTLTSGLRVWFTRTADLFTTSDTTQEPGIPSPYHILLTYYAAIPYCMAYKPDRVAWLNKQWIDGTADLIKYMGRRAKDERKVMTPKPIDNGVSGGIRSQLRFSL